MKIDKKFIIISSTCVYAVGMLIAAIVISIQLHYIKKEVKNGKVTETTHTEVRYVPTPVTTIHTTLPSKIDSQTVIRNYYNKTVYRDTAVNNKMAKVVVTDTVYQNAIAGRTIDVDFTPPAIKYKNNRVSLFTVDSYKQITLMGAYQYKKMILMGGYDFVNKAPVLGVGYQLFNW
jgi:hypothetical protein